MRGALEPLPGVSAVDVIPGHRTFLVAYDPARVDPEEMLRELAAAGEPARPAD